MRDVRSHIVGIKKLMRYNYCFLISVCCFTFVQDFLKEMSAKDEKINLLVDMGFSEDEANMAITICGMPLFDRHSFFMEKAPPYAIYFCLKFFLGVDADLSVLVDSISASQVTEVCHSRNLSDHQVSCGLMHIQTGKWWFPSFNLMKDTGICVHWQVTARCFDSFGGRKRAREEGPDSIVCHGRRGASLGALGRPEVAGGA